MAAELLIVRAGDTFESVSSIHGDFEDWVARHCAQPGPGDSRRGREVAEASRLGRLWGRRVHRFALDGHAWSEDLGAWLREAVHAAMPVFGVCYGHQLLVHALGGSVAYHPGGMEIGSARIELTPAAATDPIFAQAPRKFLAHTVHSQSVSLLPEGATRLAFNEFA